MRAKLQIMIFSIAAAAVTTQAQAGLVNFLGLGLHENVTIYHDGGQFGVNAGQIRINNGANLIAFCVDLDHAIKSEWNADNAPVNSLAGGLAAAYLYDHFKDAADNNTRAAALQVAIWEVISDFGGPFDLAHGLFRLIDSNDVRSQAHDYLAAVPDDLNNYASPSYIVKSGPTPRSQDLIVPEPATLGIIGMGLPVFLVRRRVLAVTALN